MQLPKTSITPLDGASIEPIILSKVVFPPPDGPLIIMNSPVRIGPNSASSDKEIFFNASIYSSRPLIL